MTGLLERMRERIVTRRLFKRGERVVVAVSGGVDSMVLLHVLYTLAPDFGWELSVAHFNHRLRGRSSDADERLVRGTARRLRLPCAVASAEVRKGAEARGVSIEMAARELRHAFLARCAKSRGARVVALAHHADDQVELFLLRLFRGAGGEGLGGMKARSASPTGERVTLVRPLLEFSKEEIVSFARVRGIRFREDASNASAEFERNWVRQELLPKLRRRQPAVVKNILRTMEIAGTEADFISQAASTSAGRSFSNLHIAVQRRLVQRQIQHLGVASDFQLVEALRAQPGCKVSVGPGVELVCDADGRVRRVKSEPLDFDPSELRVELSEALFGRGRRSKTVEFNGLRLSWWGVRRTKSFSPQRAPRREYFDADKIGSWLLLRHWRPGDRFQPIGMPAALKLQDWFTNRKIPAARRRRLVLAVSERGEVFWVEGERIGEAAKVTPATCRLLELRWKQP